MICKKLKHPILLLLLLCNFIGAHEKKSFWIDLYQYDFVFYNEVIQDLKNTDVVYLGETHTIERHHELQQKIILDLCSQKNKSIYIGIEQLDLTSQKELDKYNNNKINFDELAKLTNWEKKWSNYKDYEVILEAGKKCKATVIALNAKNDIIKKIGKEGISSLSKSEKKDIPESVDFSNTAYKQYLTKILQVHAHMDEKRIEKVYQAQVVRDEIMAQVIYNYYKKEQKQPFFIIVAGAGHIEYRFGIPSRLKRRDPKIKDRVILFSQSGELVLSEYEKSVSQEIEITHDDLRFLPNPPGDYLNIIENISE
ncbi:MAG: ChaN family lipoprotein [Spirochaetia bacterium]|nr:ChaN family lipoprotein [Spirochaetia bacterium]